MKGSSAVYLRELTIMGKAAVAVEMPTFGGFAEADTSRFRSRLERLSEQFTLDQSQLYIDQVVDSVFALADLADTPAARQQVEDYVANAIFAGYEYDLKTGELSEGPDLPLFGNAQEWIDISHREIRRRRTEVIRDPSMPLREHKLEEALFQVTETKALGPDTAFIAQAILGTQKLEKAGIQTIDESSAGYRGALARVGPQIPFVLSQFDEGMFSVMDPFLDGSGKGNLGGAIGSAISQDVGVFFGALAVEPDTTSVNVVDFRTDDSYRKEIINRWIRENGGDPNPTDETYEDKYVLNAYYAANREIFGSEKEEGILNPFLSQFFDKNGNIVGNTHAVAGRLNLETDEYVAQQVRNRIDEHFLPGDDGVSAYQRTVNQKAEAFRVEDYRVDPGKAAKALKNMLFGDDKVLWIDDRPVDDKRVQDDVWADWVQFFANNGAAATRDYVQPQLAAAVEAKETEPPEEELPFTRNVAIKQAKDYFTRKGIQWSKVPLAQQQAIIGSVYGRGGLDVDQAMFGQIFDGDEAVGGINQEALFGEGLIDYTTGFIQRYAEAQIEAGAFEDAAANPLNLVYDLLKERGILTPDVSTEFLSNLDNNVAPLIARRVMAGDYSSIEEIQAEIERQVNIMPAYQISSADYDRQTGATPPGFPGGPGFRVQPATPQFDVSAFTPELQEMAFDRPELAGFIQQQMMVPGFEKQWQQAAKRQVRHDREADTELQERRLSSFQSAYDRAVAGGDESVIAQAQANLDSAQAQFARETGAVKTTVAEPVTRRRATQEERERYVEAGQLTEYAETLEEFERRQREADMFAPRGQYVTPAGQPGEGTVFNIYSPAQQQTLAGMAKMMTTAGATQREFFEKQLPGFQKRFEASPFFRMEQERLEREKEIEETRAEAERRRATSRGALTVFGRRQ
jgi:hypothetical protein